MIPKARDRVLFAPFLKVFPSDIRRRFFFVSVRARVALVANLVAAMGN